MKKEKPTCPQHPHVQLRCPACIGSRGGKQTSPRKTRAARQNAKKARVQEELQ